MLKKHLRLDNEGRFVFALEGNKGHIRVIGVIFFVE